VKRQKIIVLIFVTLGVCCYGLWKVNKDFLNLWNANSITVSAETPLSKEKVKIEYGFNSINRKSDREMFDDRNSKTILYDGENKTKLINEYGENDFLITYDNKYYLSFRQFKFRNRHQHSYYFNISIKDNKVFLSTNIIGKDGMKFTREMVEISKSEKYRCNVPIDSVGTIYNMIELEKKE
jgi:hypothetical protein